MAKKQYLSPDVEINVLCCEDVLTESGDGGEDENETTTGNIVIGGFLDGWFELFG